MSKIEKLMIKAAVIIFIVGSLFQLAGFSQSGFKLTTIGWQLTGLSILMLFCLSIFKVLSLFDDKKEEKK